MREVRFVLSSLCVVVAGVDNSLSLGSRLSVLWPALVLNDSRVMVRTYFVLVSLMLCSRARASSVVYLRP